MKKMEEEHSSTAIAHDANNAVEKSGVQKDPFVFNFGSSTSSGSEQAPFLASFSFNIGSGYEGESKVNPFQMKPLVPALKLPNVDTRIDKAVPVSSPNLPKEISSPREEICAKPIAEFTNTSKKLENQVEEASKKLTADLPDLSRKLDEKQSEVAYSLPLNPQHAEYPVRFLQIIPIEIIFHVFSWLTPNDVKQFDSALTSKSARITWRTDIFPSLLPSYECFRSEPGNLWWIYERFYLLSDGRLICPIMNVFSYKSRTFRIWDWQNENNPSIIQVPHTWKALCSLQLPDNQDLVLCDSNSISICKLSPTYQIDRGLVPSNPDHRDQLGFMEDTFTCILALSDGIHLLAANSNKLISLFNLKTGERVKIFHFQSFANPHDRRIDQMIELNQSGRRLFLAHAPNSSIQIFNLDADVIPINRNNLNSSTTSPLNPFLFTLDDFPPRLSMEYIKCEFRIDPMIINVLPSSCHSLEFIYLFQRNLIISWCDSQVNQAENVFQCWDLTHRSLINQQETGHIKGISSMILLNNQQQFVSVHRKYVAPFLMKIWNIHAQNHLNTSELAGMISLHKTLIGHESTINQVTELIDSSAFSGNRLVSCSEDKTIRIWNVNSGLCERIIRMNERVVSVTSLISGYFLSATYFVLDRPAPGGARYQLHIWKRK